MRELIGVAHAHLRNALAFTLLIPRSEAGIRRFCLWAIGLAVLTLQRLAHTPGFTAGRQVKVSHGAVAMTQLLTNAAVHRDWLLRRLFDLAARGLPLARLETPYVPGLRAAADSRMPEFQETEMHGQRELRREGSSGH
jgi:farnesyl-diphosphate farnesyltransferase